MCEQTAKNEPPVLCTAKAPDHFFHPEYEHERVREKKAVNDLTKIKITKIKFGRILNIAPSK